MLVNVKIHSVYDKYFASRNLQADLSSYAELMSYLSTMHPKFIQYIRQSKQTGLDEGFVLLDSKLKEVSTDALLMKKLKEDDTVYIVPAIIGGGGKRGSLLSLVAVASFFIIPGLAPVVGSALGGASATATSAAVAAGSGTASTALAVIKGSSFLSSIATNVGLALLSAIFTKPQDNSDKNSRENGMFAGLTNSTSSGTPIALHYGMVRIGGQLVSGYIKTIDHDKGANISVEDVLNDT